MITEHTVLLNEFLKYSLWQQLLRLIATLPSPLLSSQSCPPPSLPFPSLLLPLEVGPLNTARGKGERRKLPRCVWGETPADK